MTSQVSRMKCFMSGVISSDPSRGLNFVSQLYSKRHRGVMLGIKL